MTNRNNVPSLTVKARQEQGETRQSDLLSPNRAPSPSVLLIEQHKSNRGLIGLGPIAAGDLLHLRYTLDSILHLSNPVGSVIFLTGWMYHASSSSTNNLIFVSAEIITIF